MNKFINEYTAKKVQFVLIYDSIELSKLKFN